jgi:cell division protein FtsI (penicillin-binding protein 3)
VGTALGVRKAFASKPQKFLDYLNGFGLGSTLGIDLKGEGKPSVYASVKDENWSANSLTQMSIGYEVAFTPIQILAFYNAVANGGKMVRPSFVQGVKQSNGKVSVIEPVVLRDNIASEHTLEQSKKMMEGVGEPGGTAYEAFKQSPYKVAGKTGTSWLWKNGVYQLNRYRASFVGYFPADKPKYSCIVVIEDPHGVYYASKVAAPVFRELADKIYATTLDIHGNNWVAKGPTVMPSIRPGMVKNSHALMTAFGLPVIPKDNGSDWNYLSRDDQSASLLAMNVREGLVPNCVGMGMRDAIQALHQAGYHYKVTGKGRVVGQGVLPGTAVKKGSTIHLQLQ